MNENVATLISPVPIPPFPFKNRYNSKLKLKSTCDFSSTKYPICFVEGEGGIGKSSFINETVSSYSKSHTLFITPIVKNDYGHSIDTQFSKFYAKITKSFIQKYFAIPVFKRAKSLISALFLSVPIVGKSLEKINTELISYDKASLYSIKSLLSHVSKSNQHVLCVIDDMHLMNNEEISLILKIFSHLGEHKDNFRVIASCRTVKKLDSDNKELITSFIEQLTNNGVLNRLKLNPLDDDHIKEIVSEIVYNPSKSSYYIKKCDGIPQKLNDILTKLNVRGKLSLKNGLIVLPDEPEIIHSEKAIITDFQAENPKLLKAAQVASLFPHTFNHRDLVTALTDIFLSHNSIEELIEMLECTGIIEPAFFYESLEDKEYKFTHDTRKEAFLHELKKSSIYYRKYNHVVGITLLDQFRKKFPDYCNYIENVYNEDWLKEVKASQLHNLISHLLPIANNMMESLIPQWEIICINAMNICFTLNMYSETIKYGAALLNIINNDKIKNDSKFCMSFNETLGLAHYFSGNYSDSYFFLNKSNNIDYIYYKIASLYMQNRIIEVISLCKKHLNNDLTLLSNNDKIRIKGLLSLTLQEVGDNGTATKIFNDTIQDTSEKNHPKSYYELCMMSVLFYKPKIAARYCLKSAEFYYRNSNALSRELGMSNNNLGFSQIANKNYSKANTSLFEAKRILEETNGEVYYPMINIGVLHLLTDRPQYAIKVLKNCLFCNMPIITNASVKMNIEIGHFLNGDIPNYDLLDQLCADPFVRGNEQMFSIISYNHAYFEISKASKSEQFDKVSYWYERLMKIKYRGKIISFWNELIKSLNDNNLLRLYQMVDNSTTPLEFTIGDPKLLFKPAGICFGHW